MTANLAPSDQAPREGRRYPILRFIRGRYRAWRVRHQLPFSFALHLIGIPLVMAGIVLLFTSWWPWGLGGIFVGYLLQYIGHQAEGNDVGEWAAIKRLLGLPYVAISPRWDHPAVDPDQVSCLEDKV